MSETLEWKLSPRLVNYFASSIYGQNFGIVATRELLQNALDSKASVFRLQFCSRQEIIAENNGEPMSIETIKQKLFTLGETTKTEEDTGFFGVGECAILAPCSSWEIHTGSHLIRDFAYEQTSKTYPGVKHHLHLKNSCYTTDIGEFLKYSNLRLKIRIDNRGTIYEIKPLRLARCRKWPIPHGTFTWVKSGSALTILRVNGLPQVKESRYDDCGTWIIDLDSSELLTVNRESIRDSNTKEAIEKIETDIRNEYRHLRAEDDEPKLLAASPNLFKVKGGKIPQNTSVPRLRKILNSLDKLLEFYQQRLDGIQNLQVGLLFGKPVTKAMYYNGYILINPANRKTTPITTFALKMIDSFSHELAHALQRHENFEELSEKLRHLAYENPMIITELENIALI